jgi:hypothetical protein
LRTGSKIDHGTGSEATIEYYDFGTEVAVAPPPANRIMSFENFAQEVSAHGDRSFCSKDMRVSEAGSGPGYSDGAGRRALTLCESSVILGDD